MISDLLCSSYLPYHTKFSPRYAKSFTHTICIFVHLTLAQQFWIYLSASGQALLLVFSSQNIIYVNLNPIKYCYIFLSIASGANRKAVSPKKHNECTKTHALDFPRAPARILLMHHTQKYLSSANSPRHSLLWSSGKRSLSTYPIYFVPLGPCVSKGLNIFFYNNQSVNLLFCYFYSHDEEGNFPQDKKDQLSEPFQLYIIVYLIETSLSPGRLVQILCQLFWSSYLVHQHNLYILPSAVPNFPFSTNNTVSNTTLASILVSSFNTCSICFQADCPFFLCCNVVQGLSVKFFNSSKVFRL